MRKTPSTDSNQIEQKLFFRHLSIPGVIKSEQIIPEQSIYNTRQQKTKQKKKKQKNCQLNFKIQHFILLKRCFHAVTLN